jgi:hypothetical protein
VISKRVRQLARRKLYEFGRNPLSHPQDNYLLREFEIEESKAYKNYDEAGVISKDTAKAKLFHHMNLLSEELKRKEAAKKNQIKKRVCNNAEGGFQRF